MRTAFARLAFTSNVQAVQARMGSLDGYRFDPDTAPEAVALGPDERAFIGVRDSFYQGTVGQDGWPYVQHRGGPAGFLKVLDSRTLGYADYSGNRQYVSVGNLSGEARVSLFLMDYPHQRRLKILGRARVIDDATDPALMAQLASPENRARVERGVIITVDAFDWNCPKYITPRFTERELAELVQAQAPVIALAGAAAARPEIVPDGALSLVVTGVRQLTPQVRGYTLRAPDWGDLPPIAPGAHLVLRVTLPDRRTVTRQYSLSADPARRDAYEIAVLQAHAGQGAPAAIHASWQVGTALDVDAPANQFPLHTDARPAVLIAGGIGITPLKAMAHALHARGSRFELHYSGRTARDLAYRDELLQAFPDALRLYCSREPQGARLDLGAIIGTAAPDTVFYVCGPGRLIEAVRATAQELGVPAAQVQYESFE